MVYSICFHIHTYTYIKWLLPENHQGRSSSGIDQHWKKKRLCLGRKKRRQTENEINNVWEPELIKINVKTSHDEEWGCNHGGWGMHGWIWGLSNPGFKSDLTNQKLIKHTSPSKFARFPQHGILKLTSCHYGYTSYCFLTLEIPKVWLPKKWHWFHLFT